MGPRFRSWARWSRTVGTASARGKTPCPRGEDPRRTAQELAEGERRTLDAFFAAPPPGAALLIAEAALMRAAEAWAAEQGYRKITLTVFERNRAARAVYDHLGYAPETLRYVKTF